MQKNIFKFDSENITPIEITLDDPNKETHALIRILREKHCKSLTVILSGESENTDKILTAKPYNQIDLSHYSKFTVSGNFVSVADMYLEIEVYTGTWEEMVLSEVELSFSNSPFYISYNPDALEFMVGEANESRMVVKAEPDKGFSVATTIVKSATEVNQLQNNIPQNSEAAQVIGRLYGRIKGRVKGDGFYERQEANKKLYAENFHKTLTEGFHEGTT